jgi:mono/diheme cytochrome c family protein
MERKAMMMRDIRYAVLMMVLACGAVLAAQVKPAATSPALKKPATKASSDQSEGERIFGQQCARCHNPPDGFSSRISGTVVRHMRVRASLSKHEEQEIVKFLNP